MLVTRLFRNKNVSLFQNLKFIGADFLSRHDNLYLLDTIVPFLHICLFPIDISDTCHNPYSQVGQNFP